MNKTDPYLARSIPLVIDNLAKRVPVTVFDIRRPESRGCSLLFLPRGLTQTSDRISVAQTVFGMENNNGIRSRSTVRQHLTTFVRVDTVVWENRSFSVKDIVETMYRNLRHF